MTITVRNRELGTLTVHNVTYVPISGETLIAFRSEAGELTATLHEDGNLTVFDPLYPNLLWRHEAFRPLIEEALGLWRTA
jgi:hypothetical protein